MAKILVVDDSPVNRELIAAVANNPGLHVVAEGVETLEQLQYLEDGRMVAAAVPLFAANGRS